MRVGLPPGTYPQPRAYSYQETARDGVRTHRDEALCDN